MDMDYKSEMRKLIDIVKQQSLSAPLASTLDDMKTLTTAVKDLTDRIEIRVRKSLVGDDKQITKKPKVPNKVKQAKPFPSVSAAPTPPKPNPPTQSDAKLKALQQVDFNKMRDDLLAKQQALQPNKPIPPT